MGFYDDDKPNRNFIKGAKKYGYNSYPEWLEIEKEQRKLSPDPHYYVSAISLTFLKPDGDELVYKYYQFQKKPLTIEDFVRAVRSCEDRYLIFLPKASFLSEFTDRTNDHKSLDEIKSRFHIHKRKQFAKQELEYYKKENDGIHPEEKQ